MRIAVFGNIYRETMLSQIKIIFDYFKNKQVTFLFEKVLYDFVSQSLETAALQIEVMRDDDFRADLALSIGGDGTFLNTASHIGAKQIPILGINIGRLGFLADVTDDRIIKALKAFEDGNYAIEERTLLHIQTSDNTALEYPFALNEIAILKQDSSSMISINTSVNGEVVHTYQADGLLVSTPTGSTAYSLSVGGPIVAPQAQNFILSPVASHSLNVRPLIIPDSWTIELEIFSRSNSYLIAVDGRSKVLDQKTRLRITKADYTIRVVKQKDYNFFDTLKNKLMWGVDKRM
ncbi:NAD kinase [Paludibacter sp. 221]|uniref:NAD kinase n=1 Tax=Paludibacter sp. 221 TaxID=2302939 RepID=UPI0013D581D5|nr:NAD kinase [Paludibacter sp. 221]NDV47470.1 NAD kinase [Paludibacter sp. 221]